MKRIYLDNNATTEIDPRVVQAIHEELLTPPSNPSSVHTFGQEAKKRLTKARQTIADLLHVKPAHLIFSSGGTESINMLLRGFFWGNNQGHIITSNSEHASVYNTTQALEKSGVQVTYLSTGLKGYLSPQEVEEAITSETRLIVLGIANSETGIKNDIAAIAQIAHKHQIPFVVDGVALLGKEPFSIPVGVSAMAFSAHKFHGPKGVGFAAVRPEFKWQPSITGGEQEYAKRAGTENLPGIVGMAKALEIASQEMPTFGARMEKLRDYFENFLLQALPELVIHGKDSPRLGNTSNLAFPEIDGETLLLQLDLKGIAASHGSACSSGALEPSRVLLNMGVPRKLARSSVRFSLSRFTTQEEIDCTLEILLSLFARSARECGASHRS
jgi:cysteine desulfurase